MTTFNNWPPTDPPERPDEYDMDIDPTEEYYASKVPRGHDQV